VLKLKIVDFQVLPYPNAQTQLFVSAMIWTHSVCETEKEEMSALGNDAGTSAGGNGLSRSPLWQSHGPMRQTQQHVRKNNERDLLNISSIHRSPARIIAVKDAGVHSTPKSSQDG